MNFSFRFGSTYTQTKFHRYRTLHLQRLHLHIYPTYFSRERSFYKNMFVQRLLRLDFRLIARTGLYRPSV